MGRAEVGDGATRDAQDAQDRQEDSREDPALAVSHGATPRGVEFLCAWRQGELTSRYKLIVHLGSLEPCAGAHTMRVSIGVKVKIPSTILCIISFVPIVYTSLHQFP